MLGNRKTAHDVLHCSFHRCTFGAGEVVQVVNDRINSTTTHGNHQQTSKPPQQSNSHQMAVKNKAHRPHGAVSSTCSRTFTSCDNSRTPPRTRRQHPNNRRQDSDVFRQVQRTSHVCGCTHTTATRYQRQHHRPEKLSAQQRKCGPLKRPPTLTPINFVVPG